MALPKAASFGIGLVMLTAGVIQIVRGANGCSGHKLSWRGTRAPTLTLAPYTITIPAGWRDAAEAEDEKMRDLLAKQPDGRLIVREDFDGESVFVKTAPLDDATACAELAPEVAKGEGAVATEIAEHAFGADRGCRWVERAGEVTVQINVRFHAGTALVIACSSKGVNTGCAPALAGVAVAP
jgi:hypothetical protein